MAKIIVTGATGFIGEAVIRQCIKERRVDEIVVLTRKPIKEELQKSGKVNMIIHEEFSQYPVALLDQLKGAQGCIWLVAMGGKIEAFPDLETAKKVGIGYPLVAAETFRDELASSASPKKPFRFVYCSARGAERDPNAKLWVQGENRKLKGATEVGIFDIASTRPDDFKAFALRPGGVFSEESGLLGAGASSLLPTVRVDNLAKALIEVCLKGADKDVLENRDINEVGGLQSSLMVNSLS